MNNQRQLKSKITFIIFIPIAMALILECVVIYENGFESRVGILSLILFTIYVIFTVILYFRLMPAISSVIVDYSLEQGKIQKELMQELEMPCWIPPAILCGQIMSSIIL